MAQYIKIPFAQLGDKATIPDLPIGLEVNYTTGYTSAYEADPDIDPTARYVERDGQNQIFFVLSSNIKEWQEHIYPSFITAAENGGSPFPYEKGMIVRYLGINYISLEANNQDTPPSSKWEVLVIGTAARREVGTGTDEIPDTEILDGRLGTTGNLGNVALRTVGAALANVPDNNQLNIRLGTTSNLGTAATIDYQTSATDDAVNRALLRGAWGIGGNCITATNFNTIDKTGFYYNVAGATGAPNNDGGFWLLHFQTGTVGADSQLAISQDNGSIYRRIKQGGASSFGAWLSDGTPVGSFIERPLSVTPEGYLPVAVASAVSRDDYPELFAYLGTSQGPGDGSTTFDLPVKTSPDSFYFIKY